MPTETLLTVSQVGYRLGKSPSTIRRLADAGALKVAQRLPGPNGAFLFRPADVERFAKASGIAAEVAS